MTMRHKLGIALTLTVLLSATRAAAEPEPACTPSQPCHLRMREETTLRKDNGSEYRLPPGHFYDMDTWHELDKEFKRLQNQETRLAAENKSLRTSMDETWKPGWLTVLTAVVVGAAGGVGGYYWYTNR